MNTRCIRCGADISGTAQYCDDCTAAQQAANARIQPPTTPDQPSASAAESSFQSTSTTLATCPSCRSILTPGATFCGTCGSRVAKTGGVEYAGFWMRFLAAIIDGIILGIFQGVLTVAIKDPVSRFALNTLVSFVYVVGFWIAEGATPGKMAVGCKITSENGEPLSPGQAIGRYFAQILNVLTLGIGYLMIAFTSEKRGLHDYIAGTVVIKTR